MDKNDRVWGWKSWLLLVIVCLLTIIILVRGESNTTNSVNESIVVNDSIIIPGTGKVCLKPLYNPDDTYFYCNIDNISEVE